MTYGVDDCCLSLILWCFHGLELGSKFWFVIDLIGRLISYDRFFHGFFFLPGYLEGNDLFLCGNQVLNVRSFVVILILGWICSLPKAERFPL